MNLRPKSQKDLSEQLKRIQCYYQGTGKRYRIGNACSAYHNAFVSRKFNPFEPDKERKIGIGKFDTGNDIKWDMKSHSYVSV